MIPSSKGRRPWSMTARLVGFQVLAVALLTEARGLGIVQPADVARREVIGREGLDAEPGRL